MSNQTKSPESQQEDQPENVESAQAKLDQAEAYNRANNSLRLDRLAEKAIGLDGLASLSKDVEIGSEMADEQNTQAAKIEGEVNKSVFTPIVGKEIVRDVVAAQETAEAKNDLNNAQQESQQQGQ